MFGVKPPKVKTRTVAVPVRKAPNPAKPAQSNGHAIGRSGATAAAPVNRYKLSSPPRTKATTAHASASNGRKSVTVKSVRKRKVETYTPLSSDDDSSDDDSSADGRKRQKMSSSMEPTGINRCLEPDHNRRIRLPSPEPRGAQVDGNTSIKRENGAPVKQENGTSIKQENGVSVKQENGVSAKQENGTCIKQEIDTPMKPEQASETKREKGAAPAKGKRSSEAAMIHGRGICRRFATDYKPAFPGTDEPPVVHLQYPSPSAPERFQLSLPKDASNFNPLEDIYYAIEEIVQHYLPADLSTELSSEADGTVRLLKRAAFKKQPEEFSRIVEKFNATIKKKVDDGTIASVLDSKHAIPLGLVKCILAQVYWRTVSPYAYLLKRVKGKETTYGELLPPFVHAIFQQTGLNSRSVFVDLGSGVGNVVLQSALQTGAESHGIEIMDTPAEYATDQANELRLRSKLWNINLGPITLLHGDFLESPQIDDLLRRVDVVLVNNKVFPSKLNNQLLDKFLDLRLGCKVVSLASFGGGGNKQGVRNENSIANLFDEERYDSGTGSVSWASESVEYFIMTKVR
ncbi:Nucleosomal histone H3-Lys79 methylase [Didymosphaeria variabile]|uniref:Histone-lysine N-methyltransferase, H3 lysine-79 specific n=1 Tax=Didymosphaeria variabile TaxID=1932322 RepID=A0A9W8XSL2_9PLEO|nr:Nucleosomal histone H3-Lys79 methylase [Didymosphaeria variabile]KAJ4356628.1 Nucleosomal histone H3-Lys79 methylase [Didymosphaeria variabile]